MVTEGKHLWKKKIFSLGQFPEKNFLKKNFLLNCGKWVNNADTIRFAEMRVD